MGAVCPTCRRPWSGFDWLTATIRARAVLFAAMSDIPDVPEPDAPVEPADPDGPDVDDDDDD